MNNQANIPELEARKRHATNIQAACHQLDAFTLALDELIAQLEAEIYHQPHTTKRHPINGDRGE